MMSSGPEYYSDAASRRLDESLLLTPAERRAWERRLDGRRGACGCAEGAAGLGLGLVLVVMAWLHGSLRFTSSGVVLAVALPISFLVVGKLIGIRLHRARVRRAHVELRRRLAVPA